MVKFSSLTPLPTVVVRQPRREAANRAGTRPPEQGSAQNTNAELASRRPAPAAHSVRSGLGSQFVNVSSTLEARLEALRLGADGPAPVQLGDLPPEMLDQIASALPAKDRFAMAGANKVVRTGLEAQLSSLRATREISKVNNIDGLEESLGNIDSLRPDLRTEPLRQMMQRMHALPPEHRAGALTAWRAAVAGQAVEHRPPELPRLENILGHRDANTAVSNGENVAVVARVFNLTKNEIRILEDRLISGRAGKDVHDGESVQVISAQYGICTPDGIRRLETRAINHLAGYAAHGGQNVQTVAARHGITTPDGIRRLEEQAIMGLNGNEVHAGDEQTVAARHGITTPEGIRCLEDRVSPRAARS